MIVSTLKELAVAELSDKKYDISPELSLQLNELSYHTGLHLDDDWEDITQLLIGQELTPEEHEAIEVGL